MVYVLALGLLPWVLGDSVTDLTAEELASLQTHPVCCLRGNESLRDVEMRNTL